MSKLFYLLLTALTLSAQADRFGLPSCASPNEELADRTYFILCHNAQTKTPSWVIYELTPNHLNGASKRPSHFRPDRQLTTPGASNEDYTHSGYSRGHLAPAQDFAYSDDAIRTTFLLSNAAPQDQRVNAGVWSQLERRVRNAVAEADAAYIITGPLFDANPETIGLHHVAVPSAFFKAVLILKNNRVTIETYIVPNHPTQDRNFSVPLTQLEKRTHLRLFPKLAPQTVRQSQAMNISHPQQTTTLPQS